MLALVAPGGVGAELGVFTGRFAAFLAEVTQPSTLHLVDPWWLEWGETFPDWGPYTDFGRLPTRVAHQAVQLRLARHAGTEIHVERASDWLGKLDDGALDWAYLDTTHVFEDTRQELDAIGPKLNADGLLLGDDWVPDRSHPHHGIFLAVHDRIRDAGWELVYGDRHGQWAARPGPATARR